jgi:phosphoethanolamine N-methyltransferase
MSDGSNEHADEQYGGGFKVALQHLWGDGFLSPGGPDEVAAMIDGVAVEGCSILDIGSGLGACAVLLATQFGATEVLGIDVEAHLIEDATQRAEAAGLSDRVRFQLVEPGPIPLEDNSFDIVFTKDAIVHIPDKAAFYREVNRVLKPGGAFVGSDWLRGGPDTATERAMAWLNGLHLEFELQNIDQLRASLTEAGFENLRLVDRNQWYLEEIEYELAAVTGERYDELAERIGTEQADYRRESSQAKKWAVADGFLRPTHLYGTTAS